MSQTLEQNSTTFIHIESFEDARQVYCWSKETFLQRKENGPDLWTSVCLAKISSIFTELAGLLSSLKAWQAGEAEISTCVEPQDRLSSLPFFNAFLSAQLAQTGFLRAPRLLPFTMFLSGCECPQMTWKNNAAKIRKLHFFGWK